MSWLRSTKGADLVEGAGEDIEGVLLLDELGGNAVEEPPRLLVVGRPVLGKVLCVYQRVLDHDKVSRTGMMIFLDNWTPRQDHCQHSSIFCKKAGFPEVSRCISLTSMPV